jgi:hypothetical protein
VTSTQVAELVRDAESLSRVELAALISDLLDLQTRLAVREGRAEIDSNPVVHEVGVA